MIVQLKDKNMSYPKMAQTTKEQQLIEGYATMIRGRIEAGFKPYLLTFEFFPIDESTTAATADRMVERYSRFYSLLLTRFIRNPHKLDLNALPFMIGMPDLPVIKNRRVARIATINGGLHAHAVYLVPPITRRGTDPEAVFMCNEALACRKCRLTSLHVEPVDRTPENVVSYVLKSLTRRRFDDSWIWIFPRTRQELGKGTSYASSFPRQTVRVTE